MAEEDLDLVVHLGDYIYEDWVSPTGGARNVAVPGQLRSEPTRLTEYRLRHALYRTDPDLQEAHRLFPWLVTWDDHEVENDYAGSDPQDPPVEQFLERRAAAYQAYYQHLPLRQFSMPQGPNALLYRRIAYGDLAEFSVLDTRQYRSAPPCGRGEQPRCAAAVDPATTMTGPAQERWLLGGLDASRTRWNVIAQGVMMGELDHVIGPGEIFWQDAWDGYPAARARILQHIASRGIANPVVITGDWHSTFVNDLKLDFKDPASAVVATEFVGTSISSNGDAIVYGPYYGPMVPENPHIKFFDGDRRGYVKCTLTPEEWRTDLRMVTTVSKRDAPVYTLASFVVETACRGRSRRRSQRAYIRLQAREAGETLVDVSLPTGTVTFLFTDIEGSTRLLEELGDAYADTLAEHRRVLRDAFERHRGVEVDTQGDAFFVAFARAHDAVAAASEAQAALAQSRVRVRMGIHTGEPIVTDQGYVGLDVHKGARVAAAGHGGQVVLSEQAARLVGSALVDLGVHRLKDLSEPQRLYQLGATSFPPLRTLYRTNLPVQPTPLVGRTRELADARSLLKDHRLITLVGPGGSGKTRLALQIAAEAGDEFEDGVWAVSLAAVRDAELVLATVASTLGAENGLTQHVADKHMLALLDNLEQVLTVGPEIAELLARSPRLHLLCTSREPLHVRAERQFPVDPLPLSDAATLFVERAHLLDPEFEPDSAVPAICRLLDGLPLAIELAAAHVKAVTTNQLLQLLDRRLPLLTRGPRDAPARHQTLRATIEWSYDLLDESERGLFAGLAAFAGGWTLEAAVAICGGDLAVIEGLVEKSLIRRRGERYFMLETLREFAAERLESRPDAEEIRRRHTAYYVELAERVGPEIQTGRQTEAIETLKREQHNIRLVQGAAVDDPALRLRLGAALARYWGLSGRIDEGRRWLADALDDPAEQDAHVRAKALSGAATLAMSASDAAATTRYAELAIEVHRQLDDPGGRARAVGMLANAHALSGDTRRARELYNEAVDAHRRSGDRWALSLTLDNLGYMELGDGDARRAIELTQESLAIKEQIGNRVGIVTSLCNLGLAALHLEQDADARKWLLESLSRADALEYGELAASALQGLAALAAREGEAGRAARLLGLADALLAESGAGLQPVELQVHEQTARSVRQTLGDAAFEAERAAGYSQPRADAIAEALRAGEAGPH